MKWFKHYTDASFDNKIAEVEQEFGLTGYAVYFKLIETCAMQWDGKTEPIFDLNKKKTKSILSLNYKKTQSILSLFSVLNLFHVEIFDNFYRIKIPNLAKIKDNHTKNLQVTGNKVSENLPQEKKRTDKKRKDKNIYGITPDDIIQLWNDEMPQHGFEYCRGLGSGKHLHNAIESMGFLQEKKSWHELFTTCIKAQTLNGDNNLNWRVSLTWLVDYDNAIKVLNGNYKQKETWLDTWAKDELNDR